MISHRLLLSIFVPICLLFVPAARAVDVVKIAAADKSRIAGNKGESLASDDRVAYRLALVTRILEKTQKQYGPYKVEHFTLPMNRFRAMEELQTGQNVNIYLGSESALGKSIATVIPIPASRGILNYRLLVVHKDTLEEHKAIKSLEDLRLLRTGARPDWTTSRIMEQQGFKVSYAHSYDGLFNLLKHKRVDYILRSATEAVPELARREDFGDLSILPNIAIVIPLFTYLHVSSSEARLIERIETGLRMMQTDGELKEIFDSYYKGYFLDVNMCERTLIYLDPADKAVLEQLGDAVYQPCEE